MNRESQLENTDYKHKEKTLYIIIEGFNNDSILPSQ